MDIRVVRFPKISTAQKPDIRGSLRSVVNHAPQAEAFVEQATARLRPSWTRIYEFRRRLATVAVCLITAWLFVHVIFAANGMVVYQQKRAEYQALDKEIFELQKENERFSKQISGLKTDPAAIEREAREQLHYARPGEVIYVSPTASPAQPPVNNSAKY